MASDLISIARSGARAARVALDVTANNIANASSEGYVRRSVGLSETAASSGAAAPTAITLAGVSISGIQRNADQFRQSEVRRTGADAARAAAELQGLENIEAAVDQTGVFETIVAFEASLQQLVSDPTDRSLRAATLESGRTLAQTFQVAARSLDAAADGLRFEASDGVDRINTLGQELARVNLRLSRAADASSDRTTLLDQRDQLLQKLSDQVDTSAAFGPNGTVELRIGGSSGEVLVSGGSAGQIAMTANADGTLVFDLAGNTVRPVSGSLAGKAQALTRLADVRSQLGGIATSIRDTVNAAQSAGVDVSGAAGQPFFAGTGAGDMTVMLASGSGIVTAPAGANAGSRDPAALAALRTAFASANPAGRMDALVFDVSSAVAGRKVTRDALDSIAGVARDALMTQSGVDLDNEAVNLVRFQQAFQASARVMQVARDTFDSILSIR
jgi:flagellar hook-associated protein 1